MTRKLYFGDNLEILREQIADESVDLVYLDPPFNSKKSYNVLFKERDARPSQAQIEAFDDTWHWTPETQNQFEILMTSSEVPREVAKGLDAFRVMLGENDVMAYLVMMTPRLLELHRVLKPTGSMYLHCDPTTSHYLKVITDQVFDPRNFRNEIIWKRTSAHSDTKQGRKGYGSIHDVILFYSRGKDTSWIPYYTPYDQEYLEEEYRHQTEDGRYYQEGNPTAAKPGGDTSFEWRVKREAEAEEWEADLDDEFLSPRPGVEYKGVPPYRNRYWAYSKENLKQFAREGRLMHRSTGAPRLMLFADGMPGVGPQDIWKDISFGANSTERLGFQTQKPRRLLERIIGTSSRPGDMVLDPFCGCGTTVAAAESLDRSWIGIDITYLAIALIEQRLNDTYPGIKYEVHGVPRDLAGAEALFKESPKNFEIWAVRQLGGRPQPKMGGDEGIDGVIRFYIDGKDWGTVLVSVKGGAMLNPSMVRDLTGAVHRDRAELGVLITRAKPTKGMYETAAKDGHYTWPGTGQKFQRIQIVSVEDMFRGMLANLPPIHGTYAEAPRAVKGQGEQLELG